MPYRLKANVENFEVVDGPFTGKKFITGEIYEKIPPGEEKKFETVTIEKTPEQIKTKTPHRSEESKPEVTDA